ncbi:hypothetical protein GCM10009111_14250 [Colwellia asteriadis]|uniref:Flagellar protein n=1 Tax=Colwellia asteriadis TaxID=517723 RepID=A0ABN1L5X7_9GAMM
MRIFTAITSGLFSSIAFAQESLTPNTASTDALVQDAPQVGKHVMANMDAGSMILSLLMVLALIIVSAFVLKRFNLVQQGGSQLKVITSLSLGAKERVVVVQAGDKQLLLGVTAQQISLLDTLEEPLAEPTLTKDSLKKHNIPASILSLLGAKPAKSEK